MRQTRFSLAASTNIIVIFLMVIYNTASLKITESLQCHFFFFLMNFVQKHFSYDYLHRYRNLEKKNKTLIFY